MFFGYFAVCFIVIMLVVLGILALIQKLTGIKIFDDMPPPGDGWYW